MARAITQDMDRPSLHRLHNRNHNHSINNETNIKASAGADERVAEAVVVADTVVMADIHMRP